MKNRLMAVLLTLAMVGALLPVKAYADVAVDKVNGNTASVEAAATVTEADLEALGLNLMVSIPAEVTLTRTDKNYSGDGKIYAYGFMDSGSTLKVSIDESNEAYGVVKFKSGEEAEAVTSEDNFFSTVSMSLENGSFTATKTQQNYVAKLNGESMGNYATLSISINDLKPISGAGKYYTDVPIKIVVE